MNIYLSLSLSHAHTHIQMDVIFLGRIENCSSTGAMWFSSKACDYKTKWYLHEVWMEVDLDNESVRCNVAAQENFLRRGKDLRSLHKLLQFVVIICNSVIIFPHQFIKDWQNQVSVTTH